MKKGIAVALLTVGAVGVGFLVGFGVGKETRATTESNTNVSFKDGVVTVTSNLYKSASEGISNWLDSL